MYAVFTLFFCDRLRNEKTLIIIRCSSASCVDSSQVWYLMIFVVVIEPTVLQGAFFGFMVRLCTFSSFILTRYSPLNERVCETNSGNLSRKRFKRCFHDVFFLFSFFRYIFIHYRFKEDLKVFLFNPYRCLGVSNMY